MAEELDRGHSYTESEFTEELDGFDGSTIRTVYSDKTCHYCGVGHEVETTRILADLNAGDPIGQKR